MSRIDWSAPLQPQHETVQNLLNVGVSVLGERDGGCADHRERGQRRPRSGPNPKCHRRRFLSSKWANGL